MLGQRLSRLFLIWLLLAAVFCRGLIPAGFMPAFSASGGGVSLALCSGGTLVHPDPAAGGGTRVMDECPYAAATVPVVPAVALAFTFDVNGAPANVGADSSIAASGASRTRPPARGPPTIV